MRKCWLLLKVQVLSFFGINKLLHARGVKDKLKMALLALAALVFAVGVVAMMALLSSGFVELGLASVLPAVMMMGCALMTLVATIIKGNGVLWGYRDYDTVMSLPVSSLTVVVSRLLSLYLMNLLFDCLILVPVGVVYIRHVSGTASTWAMLLLGLLLSPMIAMAIGALAAVAVTIATMRLPFKNFFAILLSFGLFFGVMALSMTLQLNVQIVDVADLYAIGALIMGVVRAVYPPAAMFGDALELGSWLRFGAFAGVSLLVGVAFVALLARFYAKINSILAARNKRGRFRMGRQRMGSPLGAMYRKELRRYFSNYVYVLNTAVGAVMLVVLGILSLMLEGSQIGRVLRMSGMMAYLRAYAPILCAFFIGMSSTTASSLSLEGRYRWILYSAPVDAKGIFLSKILVNLTVTLPAVAATGVLLAVGLRTDGAQTAMLFVLPGVFAFFIAVAGMWINLKLPQYDWTNEYTPVKRGMSVVLTILLGMLAAFGIGAAAYLLDSPVLVSWVASGGVALLTVVLYASLRRTRLYL